MSGKGKLYYYNGDLYIGQFANNVKAGKGSFFKENGDTYTGQWVND